MGRGLQGDVRRQGPVRALPLARAARAGVGLYSLAPFYAQPQRRAGLLFGYASLSEAEIRAGIRAFAEALR